VSAVWTASRAAVKRRRVQTVVIALVVMCSTLTVMIALALLVAASAPFDRAFDHQRGAHAIVTFDSALVSDAQLAATARGSGVRAAAGPFGQAVLEVPHDFLWRPAGPLVVVGRADPAGPVDRLALRSGRWATGPGEIVINDSAGGKTGPLLGEKIDATGAPVLTVVGFATSMSSSADGWVTPGQMAALHPTAAQMLYRFAGAPTDVQITAAVHKVTAGLPADAVTTTQSYLTLKRAFSALADSYLPFITVFGVLGLVVSVLIVGNVVSGAVVAGYRHIGVLKAVGFTAKQVVAVYLAMISVPAVVGCALGTLFGAFLAPVILNIAFSGIHTGTATVDVSPWAAVVSPLGIAAFVALAALVPALRAGRLPAVGAITAGSAPRAGRGLRIQRYLGGTRLPRSVSLGLGQTFTRPGRAVLTAVVIVLGVLTATLSTGLTSTMVAYADLARGDGRAVVDVVVGTPGNGHTLPKLSDAQIEALLLALPGGDRVTARALQQVRLLGAPEPIYVNFYRGDTSEAAKEIVEGRMPAAPGEVVVGPPFLTQHELAVGDRITLELNGRRVPTTIVGESIGGSAEAVDATWPMLEVLAPGTPAVDYTVSLTPGTDGEAYVRAAETAEPGIELSVRGPGNAATTTIVTFATVFTVLLTLVAALGVFNTVLLNTRERRRDLGMLKAIGMTPRQLVVMSATSVMALGLLSGLLGIPLGVLAHRLIVDHVGVVRFPEYMKDVWHAPELTALALAGVAIAVLGALLPARSATRITVGEALHTE
jgi:putative ABC transport system permease protein